MTSPRRSLKSSCLLTSCLAAVAFAACANSEPSGNETGTAGTSAGSGGTIGTAGTTGSGGMTAVDCSAALPSGGTAHSSSNAQGTAAGLSWSIWTNSGPGTITTYSVPAFTASWGGSGDFLARIGLQ